MDLSTIARIHQKGELDRAEKFYLRHLASHPSDPIVLAYLGTLNIQKGYFGIAEGYCRKALALNPDLDAVACDLMVCLRRLGRTEEAIDLGRETILRNGERWERLRAKGKLGDAAQVAANIMNNLGTCLFDTAQHSEAQLVLGKALEYAPQHADAIWNLGISQLSQGNWRGWTGYEYGFRAGERLARPYTDEFEAWKGESLTNKTVLVWGEQGVGDEILFAQCVPDLAKLAGRVIFDCHPRLERLFQRSFPDVECQGTRKNSKPGLFDEETIDFHTPIGSLPMFFRFKDEHFTGEAYLSADPERVAAIRGRTDKVRVGLAWHGGAERTGQRKRSMPLDRMIAAYEVLPLPLRERCQLVALQYGPGVFEELDAVRRLNGIEIAFDAGAIEDFSDQADMTASCDVVISVVQTTVHLAGALGVPTFCLTPYGPPWKFTPGPRMHWHASVTQCHQRERYDWGPPLVEAFEGLRKIIEAEGTEAA